MEQGRSQDVPKYPRSPRMDEFDVIHGVRVPDPYRWLEDINSEQTQNWIKVQNQVTFDYLAARHGTKQE